jgi:hypothetical protein
MKDVFAFEVTVKGTNWHQVINHATAGKAKAKYWRDVRESWPDVPFTAIRCRKLGSPRTSAEFVRNAVYRGLPNVKCGQRVQVGQSAGVIVGHNSSANFDVLFDDDSPLYAGQILNVHPSECLI